MTSLCSVITTMVLRFLNRINPFNSVSNYYIHTHKLRGFICHCDHFYGYSSCTPYSTKWVTVRGVTYKKGRVMALPPPECSLERYPVFGAVGEVYVVDSSQVHLYVSLFESVDFDNHFVSYIVTHTHTHRSL